MKFKKIISASVAAVITAVSSGAALTTVSADEDIWKPNAIRAAEQLDRGLVAMMTDDGVYLTWRMHADEDAVYGTSKTNVTYDIYRDDAPIAYDVDVTNYIDASGTADSEYRVVKAYDSMTGCEPVKPLNSKSNYFDIPLNKPSDVTLADGKTYSYTANDASCGDLDGDGEYEIILKWDCNGQDNSNDGYTGNVYLDAYKLNGTRLWRIDLGQNVRAGAHYTQFLVYDFDGDGKAEVTAQTAAGSKGGDNNYVTKTSHIASIRSYTDAENQVKNVNAKGRILTGDEFLTIFDGTSGTAIDTIYYPNQRVAVKTWGDKDEGYGNRNDRFTADVAYLDGEKPYAVYMRGYYMRQDGGNSERQAACGVTFDGEKLECKYSFDTYDVKNYSAKNSSSSYLPDGTYKGVDGYRSGNEIYVGQGNHNCTVADVDGDGKDEVMTGALCYEITDGDYLGVKWCTFKEHGDALHISDYDPTHNGYEFFVVHEDGNGISSNDTEEKKQEKIAGPDGIEGTDDDYGYIQANAKKAGKNVICNFGMSVIDAATGEILYHKGNTKDTGRGVMANTGSGGYYQFSGSANIACYGNNDFRENASGTGSNFRIFWDGDLYDELLDGIGDDQDVSVSSWNGSSMSEIFRTDGCSTCNGSKKTPALTADLFGDWREEIVMRHSDNSALRVYTTDIYTPYKMKSLMYDSVYRSGVAAEQTAYNQPPHIGYYLDPEKTPQITPDPEEAPKTLYEKGTGAQTAWTQSDLSEWTSTAGTTLAYGADTADYGSIAISRQNPSASFNASKTFDIKNNAVVTYDLSWKFGGVYTKSGGQGTQTANYTYVQIGDKIRFVWHGGPSYYLLYYSTDGGVTYTDTGIASSSVRSGVCQITAVFDTSSNTLSSLTANGKKLASKLSMTNTPNTVYFGFLRGTIGLYSNTVVPTSTLDSIKITQKENTVKPVLTPRPSGSAAPAETKIPTITSAPAATETPVKTVAPAESEKPAATAAPDTRFKFDAKTGTITKYIGTDTVVDIPSQIGGVTVTALGINAFNRSSVTAVTIPDSVTTIENLALGNCSSLKNINIGSGVSSINLGAFLGTKCEAFSVSSDNASYSSQDGILFNKDKTELIKYPPAKADTSYTVTAEVINSYAFENSTKLTDIVLSDSVTKIGSNAFMGCIGITELNIGKNVTDIMEAPAYKCDSLKTINVSPENTSYKDVDGVLFTKDGTILLQYPDNKNGTEYSIEGLSKVGAYAFAYTNKLQTVHIGAQTIGRNAFTNYSKPSSKESAVKEIVLKDGVKKIDDRAFNSPHIEKVYIPSSVMELGESLFYSSAASSETMVYCFAGSSAETYAKDNNIPYEIITVSTSAPVNTAKPTETAVPAATDNPQKTIEPSDTDRPIVSPEPSGTDKPIITPEPSPNVTLSPVYAPVIYDAYTRTAMFNSSQAADNAAVIFACYGDDGSLKSVSLKNAAISAGGINTVKANDSFKDDGIVKIYVWESVESMKPLDVNGIGITVPTPEPEPVKIMPLGDSITNGFSVAGAYRNELCSLLQRNGLSDMVDFVGSQKTGNGYDNDNEGHSGWAIAAISAADDCEKKGRQGLTNSIDSWMQTYSPDIVLLQIGTNDILSLYKLDEAPARLETLVDKVLAKLPSDGKLYLATIPYISQTANYNKTGKTQAELDEIVNTYNASVKALVKSKSLTLVDINSSVTLSDLKDGIHPTADGYAKMGKLWYSTLESEIRSRVE